MNNQSRQRIRGYVSKARLVNSGARSWIALLTAWIHTGSVIAGTIMANPNAPASQQAVVTQAANGVAQVNIQNPNSGGVSLNNYSRFDVPGNGVVLNNSMTSVQTKLAGWITANPALGSNARIIVNQVVSPNPSQLNGYMEVAGPSAQVVVANPAGITCSGCGFINASRGTLTTGTPVFDGGNLAGYTVTGGRIDISGAGLDASTTDYADIIARSVAINAGIWAKTLKITTGASRVNVANGTAASIADAGNAPAYAIDVAAVGGMYAGLINLVGTEAGVGVRNAGNIGASAGNLVVTSSGLLTNIGSLYAQGNTTIQTVGITSTGMLGAGVDASTDTVTQSGTLDIASTGIATLSGAQISGGDIGINATGISLNGGNTAAAGNVALTSTISDIDNRAGQLRTGGTLSIYSAQGLDNTNGSLLSSGSQTIHLGGNLTNVGGNLQAGQSAQEMTLSVTAGSLDNNGLIGTDSGSGGDINVRAQSLDNTGGMIAADRDVLLNIGTWMGGAGSVGASRNATFNVGSAWTLASGTQLQAGALLSIATTGDFTNQANIQTPGSLSVNAAGNVLNSNELAAGQTLSVTGQAITNNATLVGANVAMTGATSIRNVGPSALIGATDPNGSLVLLAPGIENRDDKTATDIPPTTAIYGLGNVILAGDISDGNYTNANTILNQSALLQSGGNMGLYGNTVTNTRRVLTTSTSYTTVVPASVLSALGIMLSGTVGNINWRNPSQIGSVYVDPPHGGLYNSDYLYTQYTGVAGVNTVTGISPAADAVAGGNLYIAPGTLQNYWSHIASAGNIGLTGVSVDQNSWINTAPLQIQVTYHGDYVYRTYRGWIEVGNFGGGPQVYCFGYGICINPADVHTYSISAYDSTLTANGAISGTGTSLNNPAAGNAAQGTSAKVIAGANPGSIPGGGLFQINTSPTAQYLVEANPAFTQYQQWISSDYYFQLLGVDPNTVEKRLGDGMVERQLVQSQLLAAAGQAVLSGYANAQSEYEALLTNGANTVRAFSIAPGIGLTADQVAQLTSNVVIMVSKVVDGQHVLVPQVYLAPSTQTTVQANGSLIAASNIDLTGLQYLSNGGTIRATGDLVLSGTILNGHGGTLQAGNVLSLVSTADMNLGSAQIQAGTLSLAAGGNLDLSTTTESSQVRAVSGTTIGRVIAGPQTTVNVAGDAQIAAGGNLTGYGTHIDVGGNFAAQSGKNLTLGSVAQTQNVSQATTGGYENASFTQNLGTRLTVGGTSTFAAGGDLTTSGAQIALNGGGSIQAGGNLKLGASTDGTRIDLTSAGGSSGNSYTMSLSSNDDTVHGTTLISGDSLSLSSGRDINILGSQVTLLQGALNVVAGGNITVQAVNENHRLQSEWNGSSSHALTSTHTDQTVDNRYQQSVGSGLSGESVNVVAQGNLNVSGSSLVANGNAPGYGKINLIAGGNLNLTAATNSQTLNSSFTKSGGGLFGRSGTSTDRMNQVTAVGSQISGISIETLSGGNTVLQAAQISAENLSMNAGTLGGQMVNQNAQIVLDAAIGSQSQVHTSSSQGLLTQSMENRGDVQQNLQYTTISAPSTKMPSASPAPAASFNATGGIVVGASNLPPSGGTIAAANGSATPVVTVDLRQQAPQLAQEPGLGYLIQLTNRNDVTWQKVQLTRQSWDYSASGLSRAGAFIVAIAVSAATYGATSEMSTSFVADSGMTTTAGAAGASTVTAAGAGTAGTVLTTTGATVSSTLAVGMTTLTSEAAVSLANNGGDIGKTLQYLGSSQSARNVISAMLTAGIGQNVSGYSVSNLTVKTVTGCAAGAVSGTGCQNGTVSAAATNSAAWTYNTLVGYNANAGPGATPAPNANYPFYTPLLNGQQPLGSRGNDVIGVNKPGSIFSQGGGLSKSLNQVPFINAAAGLHDYIFNSGTPFNTWTNVPAMFPAAALSIPAALGNSNLDWINTIALPTGGKL